MDEWSTLPGVVVFDDGALSARLYFAENGSGRVELRRVDVEQLPLDAEAYRRLPLARVVAWVNSSAWAKQDRVLAVLRGGGAVTLVGSERWTGRAPRLRISGAIGDEKPKDFYDRVADLYWRLSADGERAPAQRIADANDVPVTTAHRWIKEARRRGLLPPGHRGRAG